MRAALVFFRVDGRDGISDPLSVRRNLRIADVAKAREVVEFEWMLRRLRGKCRRRQHGDNENVKYFFSLHLNVSSGRQSAAAMCVKALVSFLASDCARSHAL